MEIRVSILTPICSNLTLETFRTSTRRDLDAAESIEETEDDKTGLLRPVCSLHLIWKPLGMTSLEIQVWRKLIVD